MGNIKDKDDLLKLLKNGSVEEFNGNRPYNNEDLLDLTESDLKDISLEGANLSRIDLTGSDFSEAELTNINFSESNLSSVNFSHASINGCCFSDAILEGATLSCSSLVCCDFTAAEFNGANICGTNLTDSDLSLCENLMQTSYDRDTVWTSDELLPDDFDPEYDSTFAELEDDNEFTEDEFSY